MSTNNNFQFVQSKILDTGIAIFECHTNSLLRVPNTIINTLAADAEGNIWFYIARPQQLISEFEKEFPVSVLYYKKGKNYKLQVIGTACMVIDFDTIGSEVKLSADEIASAMCSQLLIRVKIHRAEYYDLASDRPNIVSRFKASVMNLVHRGNPWGRQFVFPRQPQIGYGLNVMR